MRRRAARGMTLVELMVSSAILIIAVAATSAVVIALGRISVNAKEAADGNQNARSAEEAVVGALRSAGVGATAGVYVVQGGAPVLINPVFGADSSTGPDDLWVLTADRNTLRRHCLDRGASATVVSHGLGPLKVTCTSSFAPTDLLMVSNMTHAALLTGLNLTPQAGSNPGLIDYAESGVAGFSNEPGRGGFQIGDVAYRATAYHFYVAPDPVDGRPALYRAEGQLVADGAGRPFSDKPDTARVIQRDVEDFQVAYGLDATNSGNPSSYAFQHGLGHLYVSGLRSVRATVVATSPRAIADSQERKLTLTYGPVSVENHAANGPIDGRRRTAYTRRIELINLLPENI